jgi:hypothetical protein
MNMGTLNDEQARRLVEWGIENGLSKEKAYEAVIAVLNAIVPEDNKKEGSQNPDKN